MTWHGNRIQQGVYQRFVAGDGFLFSVFEKLSVVHIMEIDTLISASWNAEVRISERLAFVDSLLHISSFTLGTSTLHNYSESYISGEFLFSSPQNTLH